MASIFNPDEVKQFLINNGYPTQYNDGLRNYLRVLYSQPNASLPDLFVKYILEHGTTLSDPTVVGDKLLAESGNIFVLEDGSSFILLE